MKTLFEKVWERHEVVPESADAPGVRAGAHEDINLITLLLAFFLIAVFAPLVAPFDLPTPHMQTLYVVTRTEQAKDKRIVACKRWLTAAVKQASR